MKKSIIIIICCLITAVSFGQFKTIQGSSNTSNKSYDQRIINLPNTSIQTNRHLGATFHINPIKSNQLLTSKNLKSSRVFLDTEENVIGIEAQVDYNLVSSSQVIDKLNLFLKEVGEIAQISDPANEIKVRNISVDELGIWHARLDKIYKGLKVYGGEVIAHGNEGDFNFINGNFITVPVMDTDPKLSFNESQNIAVNLAGSLYSSNDPLGIFNFNPLETELILYPFDGNIYLAYHHTIYTDLINRWEYFMDANSGEIINKYLSICQFHNHNTYNNGRQKACGHDHFDVKIESLSPSNNLLSGPEKATAIDLKGISREIDVYSVGSTFYMIDASRDMFNNGSSMPDDPQGSIWTIDAFNTSPQNNNFNYDHVKSNNNSWNDRASVSAQFNGAKAYLYFRNLHTRNSINGSGGNIVSLINVSDEAGQSMGNAFWNGQAMFYGNGDAAFNSLAAGLDVAGHEMTHGVVQNTANLEYQNESGALNESFADVFGVMIDREDWLIGEDVVKSSSFPSGALRSMSDPHNGAATGDFGSGWQPKKYSERYTGTQDNGGVHINSGIPNHAFYLFATDSRLGTTENERKVKAEKVYYRALKEYLTRSSNFIDCRIAVIKSAQDLYGAQVANAASDAFDAVEIFDGSGSNNQNDAETNPGTDLILFTTPDQQGLYIFTPDGSEIANPLSSTTIISKPSVTDAGDFIVFVGADKKIHYITIDWNEGTASEDIFNISGLNEWRTAAVSKDGSLLAALRNNLDNDVVVFNFDDGSSNVYELTNPTFTNGISTGDVQYADAIEFDYTNEYLMYDANNRIESSSAGAIEYWDIGFIKVWNDNSQTFALPNQIDKLFQGLPEGVSVGNPTFSKNSNYIIAFDFIEGNESSLLGANIETGDLGLIFENSGLAYPSYSRTDDQIVFDNPNNGTIDLGISPLTSTKISNGGQPFLFFEGTRWGVWFSNGQRNYTSVNDDVLASIALNIYPNPTSDILNISFSAVGSGDCKFNIVDLEGRLVKSFIDKISTGENTLTFEIQELSSGTYFIQSIIDHKIVTTEFIKL